MLCIAIVLSTLAYGTVNARKAEYVYDLGDRLVQIKDPEGHLT